MLNAKYTTIIAKKNAMSIGEDAASSDFANIARNGITNGSVIV